MFIIEDHTVTAMYNSNNSAVPVLYFMSKFQIG